MNWASRLALVDVFVYTLVPGLFVQFFPAVITESFLMTLLTAFLLEVVPEGVAGVKIQAPGTGVLGPAGCPTGNQCRNAVAGPARK
ncbi:hypothetical protein ACFVRT_09470 [Arthrobacter koreensis]|uniref:hypothetical protein n=1 Tax=Arthrobacter koreensis TaxID=199136 RepID=UPI0036DCE8FA